MWALEQHVGFTRSYQQQHYIQKDITLMYSLFALSLLLNLYILMHDDNEPLGTTPIEKITIKSNSSLQ